MGSLEKTASLAAYEISIQRKALFTWDTGTLTIEECQPGKYQFTLRAATAGNDIFTNCRPTHSFQYNGPTGNMEFTYKNIHYKFDRLNYRTYESNGRFKFHELSFICSDSDEGRPISSTLHISSASISDSLAGANKATHTSRHPWRVLLTNDSLWTVSAGLETIEYDIPTEQSSVTVSDSEEGYPIELDLTMSEGETIRGTYTGQMHNEGTQCVQYIGSIGQERDSKPV